VSLLDALVHAQSSALGSFFVSGENPPRTGNRSQYFAPSGVYTCADGRRICITCPSQKFFRNLCAALGVTWADDPRFGTIADRLRNEDELDRLIAMRCREHPRDELLARLIDADVLTAPVNEIAEAADDPQIRHNEMIVTTRHSTLGPLPVTGVPIHLHRTPGSVRRSPPVQGEHSEEILRELGYTSEDVGALAREGAVGLWERGAARRSS
jgi:crotonobetainyl-CoA:carnitine CoA-transferase CaiB-like acyl-CoA transferase